MTPTTLPTSSWLDDWRRWHADREQSAAAPHGTTSVTGTHWLGAEPVELSTVAGTWLARDGAAVGTGVPGVDGELVVAPGTDVEHGGLLLRAVPRDGSTALRVHDPAAATREAFAGIDTFEPDAAWVVEGTFEADGPNATVTIEHHDGAVRDNARVGTLRFTIDGAEVALTALAHPGSILATFSDATTGTETQQFRFLTLPVPEADGPVVIDLNRVHLPPCAFTDHFLCPLPPAENRLTVPIRAGETFVRTTQES